MALPLITAEDLARVIKLVLNGNKSCSKVEVFTEFPADMRKARHGIYISDVAVSSRLPYSLAVNYGGNIYIATDSFEILLVSFQGDNLKELVTEAIQSIVYDNVLLDGYHERDYSTTDSYLNRAEYKIFDFDLKRMEIQ